MQPSFRPAASSDIESILDMMAELNAIDNYPFDRDLTRRNLHDFTQRPELGCLWLIEADGATAGYVALTFGYSFEFKGRDGLIDELHLREAFRGRGIGTKTVQFVLEQAQAMGIKAVHLEVERHNEVAMRLYEGQGFVGHKRLMMTRWL